MYFHHLWWKWKTKGDVTHRTLPVTADFFILFYLIMTFPLITLTSLKNIAAKSDLFMSTVSRLSETKHRKTAACDRISLVSLWLLKLQGHNSNVPKQICLLSLKCREYPGIAHYVGKLQKQKKSLSCKSFYPYPGSQLLHIAFSCLLTHVLLKKCCGI